MDKDIILHSSSKDELQILVSEAVRQELATFFSKDKKSDNNRYLTRAEVKDMLGISYPTLSKFQKNGTIKASRIGNSVRFKPEDVERTLQNIQNIKYLRV